MSKKNKKMDELEKYDEFGGNGGNAVQSGYNGYGAYDSPYGGLPYGGADPYALPAGAPAPENAETTERKKEHTKAGGYKAFSLILFLLAAGGLFVGLLSKWVSFFAPHITAGTDGALNSSLLGVIIEVFKGFGSETIWQRPPFSLENGLLGLCITLRYYFIFVLIAAVLVSLICTIVAFVNGGAAKKCMYTSAGFVLLAYGGLFLLTLISLSVGLSMVSTITGTAITLRDIIDMPTALIAGVTLLIIIFAAIIRKKGAGLLNAFTLLLTCAAIFAIFFPQVSLSGNTVLDAQLAFTKGAEINLVVRIAIIALVALSLLNLVVSCARLGATRRYPFDAVRYGLMFAAAALLAIMYIAKPASGTAPDWTSLSRLPVLLLLISTFTAFLTALLAAVVKSVKARKARKAEKAEELPPVDEEAQFAALAGGAAGSGTNPAHYTESRPEYVSADVEEMETEDGTPVYVINEPPAPAPAPKPAPAPLTDFEKNMAALARGERSSRKAESTDDYMPPRTPVQQPMQPPVFRPSLSKEPPRRPQPAPSSVYDNTQYTYDPFINSLTPQEKNEFGDIFIANKFGANAYLPAYVIGGDNREFFTKVFIYLGRYRDFVSVGLLEKMYAFVNRQ